MGSSFGEAVSACTTTRDILLRRDENATFDGCFPEVADSGPVEVHQLADSLQGQSNVQIRAGALKMTAESKEAGLIRRINLALRSLPSKFQRVRAAHRVPRDTCSYL